MNNSPNFDITSEEETDSLLQLSSLARKEGSAPSKSQYFDAMETIDELDDFEQIDNLHNGENCNSDTSSSSSSWEDDSSSSIPG